MVVDAAAQVDDPLGDGGEKSVRSAQTKISRSTTSSPTFCDVSCPTGAKFARAGKQAHVPSISGVCRWRSNALDIWHFCPL